FFVVRSRSQLRIGRRRRLSRTNRLRFAIHSGQRGIRTIIPPSTSPSIGAISGLSEQLSERSEFLLTPEIVRSGEHPKGDVAG
ncbi:hypothetical protein, partial [Solemya pervernicosa gill symbiont]|uniref:hypothetical protein n=1 Tax=Solemya pervernicosa gill symbiont TaxID=642797 RepID=UPI001F378D0E